jgi:hypothetical protein
MVAKDIKVTKSYRTTRGNNKLLFNQIRKISKQEGPPKPLSEDVIIRILQKAGNCCSQGDHYLGCVGNKFHNPNKTDIDALVSYVQECREITRRKTKDEIKQFTKEIFEKAVIASSTEQKRAVMNYRLPIMKSVSRINVENNKVCRRGIAIVYGISVKALKSYAFAKKAGTVGSFLKKSTCFTDSTILDMTFKQVEAVYRDNMSEHTALGNFSFFP